MKWRRQLPVRLIIFNVATGGRKYCCLLVAEMARDNCVLEEMRIKIEKAVRPFDGNA